MGAQSIGETGDNQLNKHMKHEVQIVMSPVKEMNRMVMGELLDVLSAFILTGILKRQS